MSCRTCASTAGLTACLFCGHAFCSLHRGELEGVAACTACLKAEHERRERVKRGGSARAAAPRPEGGAPLELKVAPAPPPPPLHEPGTPAVVHLLALVAGGAMGGYLWWFLGWLRGRHEWLPARLPLAGAIVGGLLAALGVWVIAKTRIAPEQGGP